MSLTMTTLACSATELAYLAALTGAHQVIGFPDPFEGWLAAEVEEALWQARGALHERGLIQVGPDGRVTATPEVATLVGACGAAPLSLRLRLVGGAGEPAVRQYYLTPNLAVEVTANENRAELCGLAGAPAVKERLLATLGLTIPEGTQGTTQGALLESDHLRRAQELSATGGAEAASAFLVQVGVPVDTAEALAATMAGLQATGTLLGFHRAGHRWQTDGFGFLAGSGGLWLIEPEGFQVRASPCTARAMTVAVTTWVDKLASAG